jgi:hypothetical protein
MLVARADEVIEQATRCPLLGVAVDEIAKSEGPK